MTNSKFLSFVGNVVLPTNTSNLEAAFPISESNAPLREGLEYEIIEQVDSLDIYLAIIDETTGHLWLDCKAGGWEEDSFCVLKNGKPVLK